MILLNLQDNPLMNGTLVHLYFYNILEKLQTHQFTSPLLVKMIAETKKVATHLNNFYDI